MTTYYTNAANASAGDSGIEEAPTDGNSYVRTSSAWTQASAGAGLMVAHQTITDPTGTGRFTFTSIPQTGKRLIVKGYMRGGFPGATEEIIRVNFNGITTGYHRQRQAVHNGVDSNAEGANAEIAIIPATNSPTDSYGDLELTVEGYTATKIKKCTSLFTSYCAADEQWVGVGHVSLPTLTAAVTELSVYGTFVATGSLTLYIES
jgi:hypothetical protein